MDVRAWPPTLDTDDMPKKKLANFYRAPTAEMLAYLDFSVSTTGMLAGIKVRQFPFAKQTNIKKSGSAESIGKSGPTANIVQ